MVASVANLAGVLFRHRRAVFAAAATVAAVGILIEALLPPVWRAEATLTVVVAEGRELPSGDIILAAQSDLLQLPELHREVVAAIGANRLYPGLAGEEAALEAFSRDLRVAAADARSLHLELSGREPQQTVHALAVLIEVYLRRHQQLANAAGDELGPERRLAATRLAHEEAAARLAALRQDHRIGAMAEQRPLLLRQRAQLDLDIKAAGSEIEELEGRLTTLRDQLARTPRTIPLSIETERQQVLDDAKGKLLELELREQELLGRYKDSSQFVQSVRDEMARVRGFLKDAEATVPSRMRSGANIVYQEVQKEALSSEAALNAVRRRKAALLAQIAGMDRQIADIATREGEVREVETQVASTHQEMAQLERQVAMMRAAGDDLHRFIGVNVEKAASVPPAPEYPQPWRDLPIALLLSALAGLAAALLAERFSGRLGTPQAVERRLGVPVLATLAFRP